MAKDKQNIPKADVLMGSLRSMGYSFEAAIADVIDNSISAKASTVHVLFPTNPLDKMAVGILDDGIGMSSDDLFEAMRYGSSASEAIRREDDLGRFGMGLKSASLSQCRILTVVSVKDKSVSAFSWDYNHILQKKEWVVKEHTKEEVQQIPYSEHIFNLGTIKNGTLVVWQDFDILSKASDGQVYETLNELRDKVDNYIALIFHRFISSRQNKVTFYVNNHKVRARDPFLESHEKTTFKKERTIALPDSSGVERLIRVKPYILPFATDLSNNDKRLLGGIENMRAQQGFYVYRNNRLIIWGTWFGMKPRGELTKNARIRVDIPNTLDDIWSIDIKKQTATIPKRIQNQLKNTVMQAMEISVAKQTHRGRKERVDENIDYIWDRMEGRDNTFFYQINRESKLYQFIKSKMSDEDAIFLDMFVEEIERNVPTQQIYIDKSNDAIIVEESDARLNDVFQLGVTMVDTIKNFGIKTVNEVIEDIMKSEPFCNYPDIKDKLIDNFAHESE